MISRSHSNNCIILLISFAFDAVLNRKEKLERISRRYETRNLEGGTRVQLSATFDIHLLCAIVFTCFINPCHKKEFHDNRSVRCTDFSLKIFHNKLAEVSARFENLRESFSSSWLWEMLITNHANGSSSRSRWARMEITSHQFPAPPLKASQLNASTIYFQSRSSFFAAR